MNSLDSFNNWIISGALVVATPLFFLGVVAITHSRNKKMRWRSDGLIGSLGFAETDLRPEGAVLVRGELWRARSTTDEAVERNGRIRVKGTRGHLLLVELEK